MKSKFLLSLMCGILICIPLSSQQFYFKQYQVDKGLSHNSVWCIMQDSYGFMWFGTNDGLNRFDGSNFRTYKNSIADSLSLGNNSVKALYEDARGNIWVGTNKGIFIFDHNTDSFTPFDKKTAFGVVISSEIKKIAHSRNGQIWIATLGQGVFIYNPEAGSLLQDSRRTSFVWDMGIDPTGRVYISAHRGSIVCFDQNGRHQQTYDSFDHNGAAVDMQINAVEVVNDKVWFSYSANSLSSLDPKTGEISNYSLSDPNSGTVRCISRYSETSLMVGADDGLYIFDEGSAVVRKVGSRSASNLDVRGLSDQSIRAIVRDKEGGYWIGTYHGGVNYLAPQIKNFDYYPPMFNGGRVVGQVVNRFCEDRDRNIWIGSHDCLRMLDPRTQQFRIVPIPGSSQDIRALLADEDKLWIGTFGDGVKVLDLKTGHFTEYRYRQGVMNSLSSNDVQAMYRDSGGNIYIGTSWGMCRYLPRSDSFEVIKDIGTMTSVADIMEDGKRNLWIATHYSGVFRLEMGFGVWHHYGYNQADPNSLSSNSVICLYEDHKGRIWLGTDGGGLCRYNADESAFRTYNPQGDLLSGKVIYSIEEDNGGSLWISTNAGLLRINPENRWDNKLFTQDNGLQSNQFNARASLRASNGKFYFGGINGFNTFYPDDFRENSYIPPVYIVGLNVYDRKEGGQPVDTGLKTPMYEGRVLSLPHNRNRLELEFAVLSFEDIQHNKYRYKLEGFDSEWIYSGNNNVSYANLSPGQYTFRVSGANGDGIWNEEGTWLQIIISPPWWKTTLARIAYALLGIAILYLVFVYISRRTNRRIEHQLEQYNVEKEKELYQSKVNFFVNLVHEIRTPLSLIKLPLERVTELVDDNNDNTGRYISIVNNNIDYLLDIVNQLLEFQKAEVSKPQLKLRQENVNGLLRQLYDQFYSYLELRSIDFKLTLPEQQHIIPLDSEIVRKVVVNLMSNAVKHTLSRIDMKLECLPGRIEISIADDGNGVSPDERENIFKAFYQASNDKVHGGTGIGLAFSRMLAESHNGTLAVEDNGFGGATFVFTIPVSQSDAVEAGSVSLNDIIIVDGESAVPEETATNEASFRSCRILLVEDNHELLDVMKDMLGHHFDIATARNGVEALDVLMGKTVDVVVSDVMMPEMDGIELCDRIKSDINVNHIPVILLTAKATVTARIEGMRHGADVYIEKPFSIKHLEYQIRNLLKLRLSFQKMALMMSPDPKNAAPAFNRDMEFLAKLHREIDRHISEVDFSIDYLAESLFMSRSNFYRKIKSITGMAPNDYVKHIRLKRAAELLKADGARIVDVYEQVGFNSSSYFAKCFKAQFGVLPKDYSEKVK